MEFLLQDHRYSPLHLAVLYDHLEMVKFLIKEGVNVNVKDEVSYSFLYADSSNSKIIDKFCKYLAYFFDRAATRRWGLPTSSRLCR